MRRVAVALLLGPTIAACGLQVPGGTPHDATAVFRPASMVADRVAAVPGDVVELRFPDRMTRGIMFVLEQESGSGWVYRYLLVSDANGGEAQWWDTANQGDVAIEDVGIGGPGPDRVVIPEAADPGSWRLCTGNAGDNVCVRLEIVDGG